MSTVRATILSLTSLRGVAALVVMAYHMRQVWNEAYGLDSLTPAIERGYLWVDFFFILSGFIMAYVYGETLMNRQGGKPLRDFFVARLARIYPLHIVTFLIVVALEGLAYGYSQTVGSGAYYFFQDENTPFSLITSPLLMSAWGFHESSPWNAPAWSISAEAAAYLIFPLLAVPLLLRQRSGAAVLLATSLTLYMVLETIKGSLHIYADFAVLRCLAGFFVGLALYNLGADNRIMGGAGAGLAQIIAVVGIVAAVHLPGPDGAVIPFFALLIFACRFDQGWLPRLLSAPVLVWLGTISYSLYLTHHFVWKFSRNVLVRLPVVGPHLRDGDLQWLLPFLAMGAILTVAALAYYGIEKPGRRLVHRILDQAGKGRAGAVQTA